MADSNIEPIYIIIMIAVIFIFLIIIWIFASKKPKWDIKEAINSIMFKQEKIIKAMKNKSRNELSEYNL